MTFEELVNDIVGAAQAANLVSGSGHVDLGEVELALLHAARSLSATIDLDALHVVEEHFIRTEAGIPEYVLPADFGRFIRPDDEDDTGIYLRTSTENGGGAPMRQMDAADMLRRRTTQNQRPTHYCLVAGRRIRLWPTPDTDAAGGDYIVSAVYIKAINADAFMDDQAHLNTNESTYFRDATLAQMAEDMEKDNAEVLRARANASFTRLANEALRNRQRFQRKRGNARWPRNTLRGINT